VHRAAYHLMHLPFPTRRSSDLVGTWVAITSASSATARMTSRIAAPTTTVRWATRRWSHPGRCTSARAVMRASVATAASLIADARIDARVDPVHPQVDWHVRGGG